MSSARKELAKALRTAFRVTEPGSINGKDGPALAFEDYEPPESLLEAIDDYASSSDIQENTNEKDTSKLREVLLEDCYNEGIVAVKDAALQAQMRSAFILVLHKFASLDSEVLSPVEIRYIWWQRSLKPALTAKAGDGKATEKEDYIKVGRTAARAAKELVIKALSFLPEDKENTKWRNELFLLSYEAHQDSLARKNLQEVLIGFCKAHPKTFFSTVHSNLAANPIDTLCLLNASIRQHPVQAHQIFQTPLFDAILQRLKTPSNGAITQETLSDDLLVVSLSLTTLNMLLPRLPTWLEKCLDDLLIVLARCLIWHGKVFSPKATVSAPTSPEADVFADSEVEQTKQSFEPLPSLMDYFTTLYGLFPANLLYFLTSPVQWLQSYARRTARRRLRAASTNSGGESLRPPSRGARYAGDSSTSGGEDFPAIGDDGESGGEGASAASRRKKSRAHGKGRRSKIKKQKKDAAASVKKEKEAQRQKERERRRRSANFLSAEGTNDTGGTIRDAQQDAESNLENEMKLDQESSGMTRQLSTSSFSASGTAESSRANPAKVRIALPVVDGQASRKTVVNHEQETDIESSVSSNSSFDEEEEVQESEIAVELDEELLTMDWNLIRLLSQPYLSQHSLTLNALASPEAEFARNRLRYKKLETSDLIDEITRTRIIHSTPSTAASATFSPISQALDLGMSASITTAAGVGPGFYLDNDDRVILLENQLNFEVYQKQQLVQRLGATLREKVSAGGAEADKQNLQHTIRNLKDQLKIAQENITKIRTEAAGSRERLNKYAEDQSLRAKKLRGERDVWRETENGIIQKMEEATSSVAGLRDRLAESEKRCFELEAEQRTSSQVLERKDRQTEEITSRLQAEIGELKKKLENRQPKKHGEEEAGASKAEIHEEVSSSA